MICFYTKFNRFKVRSGTNDSTGSLKTYLIIIKSNKQVQIALMHVTDIGDIIMF